MVLPQRLWAYLQLPDFRFLLLQADRFLARVQVYFLQQQVADPEVVRFPVRVPHRAGHRQIPNHQSQDLPQYHKPDLADLARARLFLVSDESDFIAGTELFVDGGCAAMMPGGD